MGMTRLSFVATAALLLPTALLSCGGGADPAGDPASGEAGTETADGSIAQPEAYKKGKCHGCHGAEGQGGMLGPTLMGIQEYWKEDELAAFIADPTQFVSKRPRLKEMLKTDYKMPMTTNSSLSEQERQALAQWVLSL